MSITVNGTNGLTFNDGSAQNTAATGFGFKNRIINGAMGIWQRGTSSSTNNSYVADRWYSANISSVSRSTDVPSGFAYSLEYTGSSYPGAIQRIESANCTDLVGQSVTISFRAKNVSGTAILYVELMYANAADNFSAVTSINNTTISASPSSSWTTYTLTVNNLPSGAANGLELRINRDNASASTTRITGVQLEKGSTATAYDYRPYGTELALCQRYYEIGSFVSMTSIGNPYPTATFKVTKRAAAASCTVTNSRSLTLALINDAASSGYATSLYQNSNDSAANVTYFTVSAEL